MIIFLQWKENIQTCLFRMEHGWRENKKPGYGLWGETHVVGEEAGEGG